MRPTTSRILAENPPEIGADRAISYAHAGDPHPCAVIEEASNGRIVAVLPSESEASRVARYAISPDGGYGSVMIERTSESITHPTFEAWLNSYG